MKVCGPGCCAGVGGVLMHILVSVIPKQTMQWGMPPVLMEKVNGSTEVMLDADITDFAYIPDIDDRAQTGTNMEGHTMD